MYQQFKCNAQSKPQVWDPPKDRLLHFLTMDHVWLQKIKKYAYWLFQGHVQWKPCLTLYNLTHYW